MRKSAVFTGLFLALAWLVVSAPSALAKETFSGTWMGAWKCAGSACPKPGGRMSGTMTQKGGQVTGMISLDHTAAGNLRGKLKATAGGGNTLAGSIRTSAGPVDFTGTLKGYILSGKFQGPKLGKGTFQLEHRSGR